MYLYLASDLLCSSSSERIPIPFLSGYVFLPCFWLKLFLCVLSHTSCLQWKLCFYSFCILKIIVFNEGKSQGHFTSSLYPLVVWWLQFLVFIQVHAAATAAKSLQSCPTLCDPIGGSPRGSPVPGILQARTLEWVAISFSKYPGSIAGQETKLSLQDYSLLSARSVQPSTQLEIHIWFTTGPW